MSLDTNNNVLQMSDRMLSQEKTITLQRNGRTNTLDASNATEVLDKAVARYGGLRTRHPVRYTLRSRPNPNEIIGSD